MYSRANTTNISELPELYDEKTPQNMGVGHKSSFQEIPEKFQKFIRGHHNGMNSHSYPSQEFLLPTQPPHQQPQQQHQPQPHQLHSQPQPSQDVSLKHQHIGSPTCLEIVDHVSSCPICSRFYKNDNIVYIIAIVMLSIICILLLKRVLNL